MRVRGLLVAVVVLAALAGGLWWSNKSEEAKAKKPPEETSPKILNIPENEFAKLEFRKADQDTVVERTPGGPWQITAPKPYRADQDAMLQVVSQLATLASDRLVEQKTSDLAQFGLTKPSLEIIITKKDGKVVHVLIGDDTPTGGGSFAGLQGDQRVFTIPSFTKGAIDKSPNDLRDKRLMTFDSGRVTRIELTAKGENMEFGKDNKGEWQILKPRPMRADGGQVEEVLRRLGDAKMDLSIPEEDAKKNAASFASATPVAIAKVSDSSGTQELQLRRDKDKNYLAKSSVVEGAFKLPADLGDGLDKGLDAFRNRKLFDFGWNDPLRLVIREGAKQTAYDRSGQKWWFAGKQMDSASMQALLDKLRDLSASGFAEKGFTTPALEFAVTAGDGKTIEQVSLANAGANWLARRDNDATLYQLDAKVVDELQKVASGVKPAAPSKKR